MCTSIIPTYSIQQVLTYVCIPVSLQNNTHWQYYTDLHTAIHRTLTSARNDITTLSYKDRHNCIRMHVARQRESVWKEVKVTNSFKHPSWSTSTYICMPNWTGETMQKQWKSQPALLPHHHSLYLITLHYMSTCVGGYTHVQCICVCGYWIVNKSTW